MNSTGSFEKSVFGRMLTLNMWPRPPLVPIIYLKGYWLNEIGFEIGKHLQVLPGPNHLVLTLEPDKTP